MRTSGDWLVGICIPSISKISNSVDATRSAIIARDSFLSGRFNKPLCKQAPDAAWVCKVFSKVCKPFLVLDTCTCSDVKFLVRG